MSSLSRKMRRAQEVRDRKEHSKQMRAGTPTGRFIARGNHDLFGAQPRPPSVKAKPYTNPDPRPGNEGYNGYTDAPKADKGLRDGSCNRTACQKPLKDEPMRWSMGNYGSSSDTWRLYYCCACARDFAHWDRIDSPDREPRCSIYPGDEK